MDNKICIMVATHKEYPMPTDTIYKPVFVGSSGKTQDYGYVRDDLGDNISDLNNCFSELTALYWGWKNLNADYIGLAHYRRHFSVFKNCSNVLSNKDIQPYMPKIKVFTPTKRRYYIESLYSHYAHTFDANHLELTKAILSDKYPEYLDSYNTVVKRTWGYMFNMMIMEKKLLNKYCTWLFDILFELRKRIDESNMDSFQLRYPGRVSEILFNVWLNYMIESRTLNTNEIKEIPVVSMEKTNWIKKGTAFLKAKFLGVKYDKSF